MARTPLLAALLTLLLAPGVRGQQHEPVPLTPPASHLELAAANMLMGGLTAAAARAIRGEGVGEVLRGFARGALGGAAVYGGKALVAVDAGPALGGPAVFTGRVLAGAGASATRNAGAGIGLLDDLVLPAGPARFHVRWREPVGGRVHLSLDLVAVGSAVAVHFLHDDLRIDIPATLASGAPTFRTPHGPRETWRGQHVAGTIVVLQRYTHRYWGPAWTDEELLTLRHERVHLLQYDHAFIQWSDRGEQALMRTLTGSDRLGRHLDLSLHALAVGLLNGRIPYRWRPWEIEAHSLAGDWQHWAN